MFLARFAHLWGSTQSRSLSWVQCLQGQVGEGLWREVCLETLFEILKRSRTVWAAWLVHRLSSGIVWVGRRHGARLVVGSLVSSTV